MNFIIINMYYIKAGRVKSDYANITRFTQYLKKENIATFIIKNLNQFS